MYLILLLLGCNQYAEYKPVVEAPENKSDCIYALPTGWAEIDSPFKDQRCFFYGGGMSESNYGGPFCVPYSVELNDHLLRCRNSASAD